MSRIAPLVFERSNQGKVKITTSVIDEWSPYIQDHQKKNEAGGIVIGRRIEGTFDIIIDHATIPTAKDRRTRFSFFRTRKPHQRIADEVWSQSNGARNYLGEWHTHPESIPTPSYVDYRDWRRLLQDCTFIGDELFFIIVGQEETCIWEGAKTSRRFTQLKLTS